jgi:two-component system, OmpR family, sensor kinase
MDGFKKRLSESIQFRLSFWLAVATLVVAMVAGVIAFFFAYDETLEFQDEVLLQIAALFDHEHLPRERLGNENRGDDHDEELRIIVQYLSEHDAHDAHESNTNKEHISFPLNLSDGLHTVTASEKEFRVKIKTMTSGERIAIAQETSVRGEVATDTALLTLMPFIILMPLLLWILANLVRKVFYPITQLAAEIDSRSEQDLHPLESAYVPVEVRPFILAINRLLDRVVHSMETQRRFVADAAHELRSPMTALLLQAERLADTEMSDQARVRLIALHQGIERGRNLLNQLLTLARVQSATHVPSNPVSVLQVYRRVLEDLLPLAEAKHIDIGVVEGKDAHVLVGELDLITVIKNLVDNSIRYTPDGGRIDLSLTIKGNRAVLQIKDSGPGIPTTEQERIFDPFYRVLGSNEIGSGLGLSIVKTIIDRIGAEVCLAFSDEEMQTGLCVTVTMLMVNKS